VTTFCDHGNEFSRYINCEIFLGNLRDFFLFLVAPTRGSVLPFRSIGLITQFLNLGRSVGLLGRLISSSQGLYLFTNIEKHIHIHKH
jgi:hypothetical protein